METAFKDLPHINFKRYIVSVVHERIELTCIAHWWIEAKTSYNELHEMHTHTLFRGAVTITINIIFMNPSAYVEKWHPQTKKKNKLLVFFLQNKKCWNFNLVFDSNVQFPANIFNKMVFFYNFQSRRCQWKRNVQKSSHETCISCQNVLFAFCSERITRILSILFHLWWKLLFTMMLLWKS